MRTDEEDLANLAVFHRSALGKGRPGISENGVLLMAGIVIGWVTATFAVWCYFHIHIQVI